MKRHIIVFLSCLTVFTAGLRGNEATAAFEKNYESLTYRLYNEQKWDSLLVTGEEAIAKGYDYYYMRVRTGVAAFELFKFVKASKHFEKALEFNAEDAFASELLYKSYLYSGRNEEARLFLHQLPEFISSSFTGKTAGPVIFVETGPVFSNHSEQFEKNRQQGDGLYSEAYPNLNAFYFLSGIIIPVKGRISLNASAALPNFNKRRIVDIAGLDSLSGDYKVKQTELYFSPSVVLGHHIKISPVVRWVNVSLDNPLSSDDPEIQKYIGPPGSYTYQDYAIGGEVSFLQKKWMASVGYYSVKLDNTDLNQANFSFFYRPLGNLNLYLQSVMGLRMTDSENDLYFSQMAGGKLAGKLWAEATFVTGNISGTGENNFQVFYNLFDETKSKYALRFIYTINDHLKLNLRGQWFFKQGTELYFSEPDKGEVYTYNYQTISLTGGFSWNF